MVQEGPLIKKEVTAPVEKACASLFYHGVMPFLDKPILLVQHRMFWQHTDGFQPCMVERFILRIGEGENFRQFQGKGKRCVTLFRNYDSLLHVKYRQYRV